MKTHFSEETRQYWLDTVLGWAEARLMPPQYDEFKIALTAPSKREWALIETVAKIAKVAAEYGQVCANFGDHMDECDECDGILIFCAVGSSLREQAELARHQLYATALAATPAAGVTDE